MPAHRKYSDAQIKAALKDALGYISVAADALGCDPETIGRRLKANPKLRAWRENFLDRGLDRAELSLDNAVLAGEGWAVCFKLKCHGKRRGYIERGDLVPLQTVLLAFGDLAAQAAAYVAPDRQPDAREAFLRTMRKHFGQTPGERSNE